MVNVTNLVKYIDIDKWQHLNDARYQWQGKLPLSEFPRLLEMSDTQHITDNTEIYLEMEIYQSGDIIIWQLATQGNLWQTCQRCLEPVATKLNYNNQLILLKHERHLGLIEQDSDYLLLDEIVENHKLYLLPIIEDELLMLLPMSPKHEHCDMLVSSTSEIIDISEENPFAMLAKLKTQ